MRRILLAVLVVLFLGLPPSLAQYRNPPPANLVAAWWLRESTAIAALILSGIALFGRNRDEGAFRIVYYVASGMAAAVGLLLLLWPLEFPCPFRLAGDHRVRCHQALYADRREHRGILVGTRWRGRICVG